MTKSWLALLALGAAAVEHVAAAEPRVVSMPMHRVASRNRPLRKRASSPQPVTLSNAELFYLYYVNATVGTPPQNVALQIDTGSSDVWMFGPQVCEQNQNACDTTQLFEHYFDPSKSSTYKAIGPPGLFEIQYVTPGSGVSGDYFSDNYQIGDIQLTNLTMAVATKAQAVNTGIMGIGFADDESIVSNSMGEAEYPNIIDVMVTEGKIASHAYSLYLDDREASTGVVLFGGYDTTKYDGQLTVLDIQPDSMSGTISSFTVAWSFIGVTAGDSSSTTLLSSSDFPIPAVLDSGTSLTVVPQDIFQQLANYFNATNGGEQYGYLVPCSIGDQPGSVDYGFGGSDGGVIQVPFSELALPTVNEKGEPLTFGDGTPACSFGLDVVSQDSPVLLGDTFLRSAYVIYDLDAKQIAIAQANYNQTSSNYVEIQSSNNLASVLGTAASVATGATATQTMSGQVPAGNGGGSQISGTTVPTSAGSSTGSQLTGVMTTLKLTSTVDSGDSHAASPSSSGAAPAGPLPPMQDLSMLFVTLFGLFASGAAMMAFF